MAFVEIRNLVKQFGEFKAVNGLDMDVNKGEIFGLLGLNGAGKSTTMRCMLTLIKPTSGTITYSGQSIDEHRAAILRNIGCFVDRPDHYNYLSAIANLNLSARLYGCYPQKKEMLEMLELVGLKGKENQKVKSFSQGMKQRLGIAATLMHNPELVILDEPTNGLDPQGIIDLRNLVLKLKEEMGKTVILSSHILSEIEMIADSMVIVHRGKNIAQGKVSELLSDKEIVMTVETDNAEALAAWVTSAGMGFAVAATLPGQLTLKAARAQLPELHRVLSASDIRIYNINTRRKLEDLFLTLTHSDDQPVLAR